MNFSHVIVSRWQASWPWYLERASASGQEVEVIFSKLKVEFSAKLGGPCGDNRRTFVDEVIMYTRLRTPLIGVRKWKDVKQDVKNSIADCVMVCICHIFIIFYLLRK